MLNDLLNEYEKAYKKEWSIGLSEFMKTVAMDVFRWLDSESRITMPTANGATWESLGADNDYNEPNQAYGDDK
jgi:hypothetical protein